MDGGSEEPSSGLSLSVAHATPKAQLGDPGPLWERKCPPSEEGVLQQAGGQENPDLGPTTISYART